MECCHSDFCNNNGCGDNGINTIRINIGLLCFEKCRPEGKRIISETMFTEFPASSVDLRVGISRPASETDD